MGILNVTPDSFYDGGRFSTPDNALRQAGKLVDNGADIIDLGGESTRPESVPVEEQEELKRILPVLRLIKQRFDVPVSVDTSKSGVARIALEEGAEIVNDISGFAFDPNMPDTVAGFGAGIVLMHIKGTPGTMQIRPEYDDLVDEVSRSLRKSIDIAESAGIGGDNIVIDPGIGFGKRLKDNYTLIRSICRFKELGRPVLIGPSRKSFVFKLLGCSPEEGLAGTISAALFSFLHGADILRVHDVREVNEALVVAEAFISSGDES